MKADTSLEQLAKGISPSAVRDYAKATGWEHVRDGVKGRIYLFRHSTDRLRQLAIPMDFSEDYADAIVDATTTIASLEGSSVHAVLTDLMMPDADIIRFRVATRDEAGGTLPLQEGINLLDGARKAVLAAACSVVTPQSHHPRMSRTESDQLLSSCRLGQTEKGSFVVKIACPLSAVRENSGDIPFVRKTTKLLLKSAHRIVEAIERDDVESVYSDLPNQPVISSNLCDAILQMQDTKENASLSISAKWASVLPEPSEPDLPPEVTFNPDYFGIVEDIHLRLRPSSEDSELVFPASVETLNGDVGDDGRRSGDVMLYVFNEQEILRARVTLDPDQYEIADQAHMEASFVLVKGVLHRGRRVHRITDIELFQLLRPEPSGGHS
ncbi:MAG: hypothetical protein WA734_07170 [Candidatus Acidiferrales bacterium]